MVLNKIIAYQEFTRNYNLSFSSIFIFLLQHIENLLGTITTDLTSFKFATLQHIENLLGTITLLLTISVASKLQHIENLLGTITATTTSALLLPLQHIENLLGTITKNSTYLSKRLLSFIPSTYFTSFLSSIPIFHLIIT